MTTEPTNLRLDSNAKHAAYAVFEQVGIKPAQAINLFLHQVALRNALPFEIKIPNANTLEAMQETENSDHAPSYGSFSELRSDIGI